MSYANEGIDQRAEVAQGLTDSVGYYVKAAGVLPSIGASAFVTILDPGGTEKVARTAATITGNLLSLSQSWTGYSLEEDFVAVWEWTVGGIWFADRQYFDVVKTKLPCLVDTSDLEEFYPNLQNHLKALEENTDAGKFIRRAWSHLMDRLRSGKNRPSLVLDRARLVNPGIQIALWFASEALTRETDDVWDKRAAKHEKRYEALMAGLGELKYDADEDGLASNNETKRVNRRNFQT
jgi:hypothetical protein